MVYIENHAKRQKILTVGMTIGPMPDEYSHKIPTIGR
jgi:hypothetical protein